MCLEAGVVPLGAFEMAVQWGLELAENSEVQVGYPGCVEELRGRAT